MRKIFNLSASALFIRSSGELLQEYKGHACKVSLNDFFFLKHAGELHIIILRRKRGKNPYNTHPHTHPTKPTN